MSEGRSPLPRGSRWIRAICVPCLLVIAVLASMGQVALHRFGPVDDPANIWENPKLNPPRFDSEGVLSYWLRPELGLYIPVTYTVWGILAAATWSPTPDDDGAHVDPRAFHAASLLFYTLSVLAVYAILLTRRSTFRAISWPEPASEIGWCSIWSDLTSCSKSVERPRKCT